MIAAGERALRGGRGAVALLGLLAGCVPYRAYPLLALDVAGSDVVFEPSGLTVLGDGTVVVSAAGPADALYEPLGTGPGATFAPTGLSLPLSDPRLDCPGCKNPPFRATARLAAHPIRWLPGEDGEVRPVDIEDLASFGGAQVLGVTAYSTIGRRTGYRKDNTARPRQATERVFVLERMAGDGGQVGGWEERRVPGVERFRDALSDWGRSHCDGDMRVQGLAWNELGGLAYVGLRRCDGPTARVLSYDLRAAAGGQAVDLVVLADGVVGGTGPEEGITALGWDGAALWATTAWDSWGQEAEPAWGGRLLRVEGGALRPVGEGFLDRPSALWLPQRVNEDAPRDAVLLFDDDSRRANVPGITFVTQPLERPEGGRWAGLAQVADLGEGQPLGLNGFDLRWYDRDHRLAQLGVVLDRREDGTPGAWTRAVGGLWQMRVGGTMGIFASATGLSHRAGHDRQAVALTDWRGSPDLKFHAFRAEVSVVPRDRERQNPSVARLVAELRPDYTVTVPLPVPASPGAGLVLQGLEIDTAARADRGICVAAMDVGVAWHSEAHDAVDLRAMLIGGLCNDFDTRGSGLQHGRTTDVDGGVSVAVRFAVVEGASAVRWSAQAADLDLPAPRDPNGVARVSPVIVTDDAVSRAHVHCVALDGAAPVDIGGGDPSWRRLALERDAGVEAGGALSGFTLALDPAGFDDASAAEPLSEAQALNRNAYIHRYLLRAFGGPGAVLEGGITHGIHRTGFMRDNQTPSALLLRADMTGFPGALGEQWDMNSGARRDPNVLPEDGFVRWAVVTRRPAEAQCSRAE